jgi:hypothetical protein
MSHTPAPWKAKGETVWNADEVMYVAAKNFDIISPSQTLTANARLIAAAPDLLAACKEMAEILHSMSEGGVGAEQGIAAPYFNVIRKAEGKE